MTCALFVVGSTCPLMESCDRVDFGDKERLRKVVLVIVVAVVVGVATEGLLQSFLE